MYSALRSWLHWRSLAAGRISVQWKPKYQSLFRHVHGSTNITIQKHNTLNAIQYKNYTKLL